MFDDQIPLASYTEEIRALIHTERNAEALALCKHVLRYYPKHIETYRLTAEASMESGDADDAQELFRRVLSADPEDYVAYAGLAIIFEQKRALDEAIWHLERANELTPANMEIRKELLRLYGEAEDKPRARLKLTPAGLARLYVQEGLFAQAIHELRALVAADPQRFDARVALAETLWHAGRIRESADVALHLLDSLPYCLKANLILGATYHETNLPEADAYLQRAQELDPGNHVALKLLAERSPLQLAQAMVPRFAPGAALPEPSVPEKTASAIFAGTPAEAGALFESSVSEEPAPAVMPEPAKPGLAESGLPAWLRADFRELAQVSQPQAGARPIVKPTLGLKSTLPPWLTAFQEAREQPAQAEAYAPATATEPAAPAWLSGQLPSAEEQPATPQMPVWLSEPATVAEEPPAIALAETPAEAPVEAKLETAPDEGIPDWLRALREGAAQTEEAQAAQAAEEQAPIQLAEILPRFEERAPEPVAPTVETPPPPPPQPRRKRKPRAYNHLVLARELRDANRVEDALVEYEYVVRHGPRLMGEVIDDLKELISMWGAPLDAHRILGDAYTRADRLADALERYRFVMERVSEA